MPQKERLRVFNGELKKTSGGLTKDELVKNKRGKIVSKRKSSQAVGTDNNLGSWLRSKGDKFSGKPRGFKADVPDDRDDEKLAVVPEKPKPKPKVAKKVVKPKVAKPKPKVVKKVAKPKPKVAKKVAKKVPKKSPKVGPMKPGEVKDLSKISVGNIYAGKSSYEKKWDGFKKILNMTDEQLFKKLGQPSDADFARLPKKLQRYLDSKT